MTIAVFVLCAILVFVVAIAVAVGRRLRADFVALRESHNAALRAEQDQFNAALGIVREAHREEIARLTGVYESALRAATTSVQETIRLVTTGSTQPVAPQIAEREVDPQVRVARQVATETIERGVAELRGAYRKLGINATDEELREEVELMLMVGTTPPFPREPQRDDVPEAARA